MQWKSMATISAAMSARNENRTSRRHLPPLLPETCQQNCVMLVFLYYLLLFGKGIKTEKKGGSTGTVRDRETKMKKGQKESKRELREMQIHRL